MNKELLNVMKRKLANEYSKIIDLDGKLRNEYSVAKENGASVSELNEIAKNINELEAIYRDIKADIDLYMSSVSSGDVVKISLVEDKLMKKYGVDNIALSSIGPVPERTKEAQVSGSKTAAIIAGSIAGVEALILGGLAISSCNQNQSVYKVQTTDKGVLTGSINSDVTNNKNGSVNDKTEKTFVDASNDEQLKKQAQLIYDSYVNTNNAPEAFKSTMSVDRISDVLRMSNGHFKLVDGNVSYNAEDIDLIANYINEYANSTSYKQYGQNLQFKPMAVFFEQDTDAYEIVNKGDELMSKVYEDIRTGNVDKFKEDAINWGVFVKDTLEKTSLEGNTKSIWTLPSSQQFYVAQALTSQYACSIMEYGIALDLADANGNTHSICIPYCYNESGALVYKPLSELIYDINNTPMNDLAARAGHLKEWHDKNESIMWELGNNAEEYYNSKYELEVGYSKKLK